jgi:ADP-ribose pyrophosphatase YjhB (NUDIX family)
MGTGKRSSTVSLKVRLLQTILMPYWRLTRGMTLGAQGMIIDAQNRVLLVRHGYRPGWHFPGGGVEWRETLEVALAREIEEETGVIVEGETPLHGLFANFTVSPSDHVALFLVKRWTQPHVPASNHEIAEQGFFAIDVLPGAAAGAVRRRVGEIFHGQPVSPLW